MCVSACTCGKCPGTRIEESEREREREREREKEKERFFIGFQRRYRMHALNVLKLLGKRKKKPRRTRNKGDIFRVQLL